jgi:hypothetical protein
LLFRSWPKMGTQLFHCNPLVPVLMSTVTALSTTVLSLFTCLLVSKPDSTQNASSSCRFLHVYLNCCVPSLHNPCCGYFCCWGQLQIFVKINHLSVGWKNWHIDEITNIFFALHVKKRDDRKDIKLEWIEFTSCHNSF